MDRAERSLHHQSCWLGFSENYTVLLFGDSKRIAKHHGLQGIHSLEALCRQGGCSYCPWCAKEGQNEGTMVNHPQTVHYHLGLVCTLCLAFFTTSADTMRKHKTHCTAMATEDQEEKISEEGQW